MRRVAGQEHVAVAKLGRDLRAESPEGGVDDLHPHVRDAHQSPDDPDAALVGKVLRLVRARVVRTDRKPAVAAVDRQDRVTNQRRVGEEEANTQAAGDPWCQVGAKVDVKRMAERCRADHLDTKGLASAAGCTVGREHVACSHGL
jgi:hypothetical protein